MAETVETREVYFERLRVARLGADGGPVAGADNGYVTSAVVRLGIKPQFKAGKEITKEDGRGNYCLTFKVPDVVTRYDMELEICGSDPELTELLAGGAIFRAGVSTESTGYRAPRLGAIAVPNGVSIEGWSDAVDATGSPLATLPYMRYAFPKAYLNGGDWSLEADAKGNTFTGYCVENANWGDGPFNDWAGPSAISAWQRYKVATLPASALGYTTVPAQP